MVRQVRAAFDHLRQVVSRHRRQSVGWLIVCLSLALVTTWLWTTAKPAEKPVANPVETQGSPLPVRPTAVVPAVPPPDAQPPVPRDPFVPPPGYVRPVQAVAGNAAVLPPPGLAGSQPSPPPTAEHSASAPVSVRPQLVGVADSREAAIAIIRYGPESHSCRVADHIGPYRVSAIDHRRVTLQGPEGTIVLELGR